MFITNIQTNLKLKANTIQFISNGNAISAELESVYNEMKLSFSKITQNLEKELNSYNCIVICKEMLNFYHISHELLQNILTECFRDSFYINLDKMEYFFGFFNKVCKMMVAFDLLKIQNPLIFSNYCESKLRNEPTFDSNVEQGEDSKICILNLVSLPLGRLFLSFFSYPTFDLEHPSFLSKTIKIQLNPESKKRISLFIYISERSEWRYLMVYFITLFYKLEGNDPFNISYVEFIKYKKYMEMLKQHF